jgi:hypothetical protein
MTSDLRQWLSDESNTTTAKGPETEVKISTEAFVQPLQSKPEISNCTRTPEHHSTPGGNFIEGHESAKRIADNSIASTILRHPRRSGSQLGEEKKLIPRIETTFIETNEVCQDAYKIRLSLHHPYLAF